MAIVFEHIEEKDTLNKGRKKLNNAIDASEAAYDKSQEAVDKANQSLTQSTSTQDQLNQVLIEGDSSVEAAAARVDANGDTHTVLKDRLDYEYNELTQERDQVGQTLFYYDGNGLVTEIETPTKEIEFVYDGEDISKITEIMEHRTIETTFTRVDGIVTEINKAVV